FADLERLLGALFPVDRLLLLFFELALEHLAIDHRLFEIFLRVLNLRGEVVEHQRDFLSGIGHGLDGIVQRAGGALAEAGEEALFFAHRTILEAAQRDASAAHRIRPAAVRQTWASTAVVRYPGRPMLATPTSTAAPTFVGVRGHVEACARLHRAIVRGQLHH